MSYEVAVLNAIRKNLLFSTCDPADIEYSLANFTKGDQVRGIYQNQPSIGLVIQGSINVYSVCYDGSSVHINTHNPGDCFGFSTIFTGEEISTLMVCGKKTVVAYVSKAVFLLLLEKYPDILFHFGYLCNRKISFLTQKIEFLTLPSCRARLATFLLRNRDPSGRVVLKMPKEQLAKTLGTSRASLFRELHKLTQEGLIALDGKKISLLDQDALLAFIQEK